MAANSPSMKQDLLPIVCRALVLSPCSESKSDKVEIPASFTPKNPTDYLDDRYLLRQLDTGRRRILKELRKQTESPETLAIDLYVGAPHSRAYRRTRELSHYQKLRRKLFSGGDIEWFFLSGGYGVVNALERVQKYNASFAETKVRKVWQEEDLPAILDGIVATLHPLHVYVFGNTDYVSFVLETTFYQERKQTQLTVFERRYTEPLTQLVGAIINDSLDGFKKSWPGKHYRGQSEVIRL
jgi:hypothetical protein